MTNIQLLADKNSKANDFLDYHNVADMPWFILLDKNGNVISENAPYPTDSLKVRELINKNL